jgi:BolA protein
VTESRIERLRGRITGALQPAQLDIVDNSRHHAGHAGAADGRGHFSVLVVSEHFAGLNTLRRHRLVYDAVGDLMLTDIHALSIQAFAPGEADVN